MKSIFRRVKTKDRMPDKRTSYYTNKGVFKWCKKHGFYNERLFNINKIHNVKWWLEEVEIPDDEILDALDYNGGFKDGVKWAFDKLKTGN